MPAATPLYRAEAIEAMACGGRQGAALGLQPGWLLWSYRFLIAVVLAGVAYVCLARAGDYAHGPAVVRVEDRHDLTTATGGIVVAIDVRPGQRVRAGQPLVRFHGDSERRELARLQREFDLKLARILLHPRDDTARQSLAALRATRELEEARLAERQVVAPRAGVVRNLRIRPGQMLAPGDVVLTLADESRAEFSVVALVPGRFRPMLRPGMPLRFELDGYPQVASVLTVRAVGEEVVGPAEVRRTLGQDIGDAVALEGALVLVHARLPARTFAFEGQRYRFYDGIPGRVDVRVRDMPLAMMLFPPLKELFRRGF
jgi:multidrug efflux pump subunit AcrA (membrane-fusion protein)